MSTVETEVEKIRIILTSRAPVRVDPRQWPVIASASERPGSHRNGNQRPNYETDHFTLRVRQHADGRTIVSGRCDAATSWTGSVNRAGGEILEAGADIAEAIERVAQLIHAPETLSAECIADLPVVDL